MSYLIHIFVEISDVVLKEGHKSGIKSHFDEVSEAHGLKPYSKGESVRSHVSKKVSRVVKPSILFKVVVTFEAIKPKIVKCGAVL